jgi:hypothetical protein
LRPMAALGITYVGGPTVLLEVAGKPLTLEV